MHSSIAGYATSGSILAAMQPSTPNPYRDATLAELRTACTDAVRAIENRERRTPAERQAFAADLRFLLLAIALRLHTGPYSPGEPENTLNGDERHDFVEVFEAWHRVQLTQAERACRTVTLQRAADYMLGRRARDWLHPSGGWKNGDRGVLGILSDEALHGYLTELGKLFERRRRPGR